MDPVVICTSVRTDVGCCVRGTWFSPPGLQVRDPRYSMKDDSA